MKYVAVSKKCAILVVALLTGFLLTACKGNHEGRGGMMFDVVAYKLDLTEHQEEKWFAIRDEFMRTKQEAMKEKLSHFEDAKALLLAENLDQERVLQALTEHQQRIQQAAPAMVEKLAEFHRTLSPEQKEKMVSMLSHIAKKKGHDG